MCGVCKRIEEIKNGVNPFFVCEMETGYVVLGDCQRFEGYTLFLCKQHATELHFLSLEARQKYLAEMAVVAEAVYAAFQPEKLNYELLGMGENTHMHWHIFPRNAGDTPSPGPVWRLPGEELWNPRYTPSPEKLEQIKKQLRAKLVPLVAAVLEF